MHQPFYKDPVQGEYILPWTYLHAVKDYYDMPAIVDATPGAKVVFNLVPSLLEQIQDYAAGTASDPFLVLARRSPAELSEEEKLFLMTTSPHAASFDLLFRRHLMNIYRLLDVEVPGELHEPIKKQFRAGGADHARGHRCRIGFLRVAVCRALRSHQAVLSDARGREPAAVLLLRVR